MEALIVCNENEYELQGYLYKVFKFWYKCPNCEKKCRDPYCGQCGTKIEYPEKPKNFELFKLDGDWIFRQ